MNNSNTPRVLIVEDDLLLSMVEERLIENLGYSVIDKVGSGSEAIKKVSELNPDVIVMDISLKGDMDGIETMEVIRQNSDIPVIYLSGSSDRYDYERAKKTDFSGYLLKPVTSGDLKKPFEKALSKQEDQKLPKSA